MVHPADLSLSGAHAGSASWACDRSGASRIPAHRQPEHGQDHENPRDFHHDRYRDGILGGPHDRQEPAVDSASHDRCNEEST
jgi:hypothetical protein